jgi:hypothetical protein
MADMQDDEVLLGEADASEGLLELGAKLKKLDVQDSQDAGDEEGEGAPPWGTQTA